MYFDIQDGAKRVVGQYQSEMCQVFIHMFV